MRTGLIAVILIMGAALAVLLMNLVPLFPGVEPVQPAMRKVRPSVTSAVSLGEAEARAAERALSWAPDARLVRVEATWYVTPGWEQVNTPPVAWGFYYYSAAEKSLVAAVIDDEVLLWVPPFEIPSAPRTLDGYPPGYGPDGAWLTFRAAGGDLFLRQHPEAQVSLRLQPGDGGAVWNVAGLDETEFFRVIIDARTGLILSPDQ